MLDAGCMEYASRGGNSNRPLSGRFRSHFWGDPVRLTGRYNPVTNSYWTGRVSYKRETKRETLFIYWIIMRRKRRRGCCFFRNSFNMIISILLYLPPTNDVCHLCCVPRPESQQSLTDSSQACRWHFKMIYTTPVLKTKKKKKVHTHKHNPALVFQSPVVMLRVQ